MIHKLLLIMIAATGFALGACEPQGPAEETGEEIDQGIDEAGDEMEETGDEIEDEFDDTP
ncbi:MAG: hypothetical protein ACREVN_05590 [Gammaproteobacteria bacterium]